MANYRVNRKSKTITILGELTEIEKQEIELFLRIGYIPKHKRTTTAYHITDKEINDRFDKLIKEAQEQKDEEKAKKWKNAKKAYNDQKNVVEKNRKIGFLGALKWLRNVEDIDIYYGVYDAIMMEHETEEKTEERREKYKKAREDKKAEQDKAEKAKAEVEKI